MALKIFLLFCLVASITAQCTIEKAQRFFKRSVYDFTMQLSIRISQETEGHFIASGLSPWTLISAISLGATQETLSEIAYVLKMHPHLCFNRKYFEIARQLTSKNDTILERSAAIFIDRKLDIKEDFVNDVSRAGICSMEILGFDEYVAAAAYINDYVSQVTHEAIDEIVAPSDLEDAYIVMVDALYFKGAWQTQFPYADTETSAFYDSKGAQTGDVNLMYVTGTFNLTSVRQIQAKVLELPYGDEKRFSMLIFLPNNDLSIGTILNNLKDISLRTIFAQFERRGEDTVSVQIPRFKVSSDINNLKELLIDMGLNKMFDSSEAKFEDLTDYPIYVSNFIQKAEIDVTEDGTEASAVSEATFQARTLNEQFVANKPFIFMIIDRATELPLFTGAYSKPNVF